MRIQHLALSGILLLYLLRPDRCLASDPAVALSLSEGWLRLGHYQRSLLGGYSSRVVSEAFFLSPTGRTDPESELQATIAALRSPEGRKVGALKQSPECAFPARRAWLLSKGVFLPEAMEACKDRDEWKEGLGATGATLVFSSAYPNNPASMFGHSLLMLNHASGEPILNYGVNYEARVDAADNSVLYGLKGLLGLYPGEYSIAPYYTKINEYNYSESRDLWEYELNLSQAEVRTLVDHLWELFSQGGFRYYFLDDNCSFQLMTLLEVAKPDWRLTHGYGPFTLPLDTVKKVASHPGAIRGEKLRPSLYRRLSDGLLALSSEQKAQREKLLSGELEVNSIGDMKVIESALTYLDYLRRREKGLDARHEKLLGALLLHRSKFAASPGEKEAAIVAKESPLRSHGSHLVYPGLLFRGSNARLSVGGRITLHDLIDPGAGFASGFSIDFAKLRLSYGLSEGDRRLRLDEFQLIDILSLYPVNSVDTQISWTLRAGTGARLDFDNGDSLGTRVEGGPGLALAFAEKENWLYALGLLYGEQMPNVGKKIRAGAGAEAGFKAGLGGSLQVKAGSAYRLELNRPFDRAGFFEHTAQAALTLGQNWQIRTGARTADRAGVGKRLWDYSGELRWYF